MAERSGIKPPKPLSFEGNAKENWTLWKQRFEFYLRAIECTGKPEQTKAGIFLTSVGDRGIKLYNTLKFDADGDKDKYSKIIEKFEAYVNPRTNITFARHKFFTYKQKEGQSFDLYLTEMTKLSNDCDLGNKVESILRDMVIIGLKDKRLQEGLLRKEKLPLEEIIAVCKSSEIATERAIIIQKDKK